MTVEALQTKIQNREYKIGIIGLGYVGLPLMWTFHQKICRCSDLILMKKK